MLTRNLISMVARVERANSTISYSDLFQLFLLLAGSALEQISRTRRGGGVGGGGGGVSRQW